MTLADDPLLTWRAKFPALEKCVHLISHSLGCVPAKAEEDLAEFYDLWQTRSITAWDEWIPGFGFSGSENYPRFGSVGRCGRGGPLVDRF